MYNIRITIISLLTVLYFHSTAQRNTSSPYSRYGYGLLSEKSLCFNQGLSHTGIGIRVGNHLNFANPAGFTAIDSSHFIFETGIKNLFTSISEGNSSATTSNSNMEYLAVGFPVARWWGSGIALMPFSKVGYAFENLSYLQDSTLITTGYIGNGGSNQVVWSNAFSPFKGLSLGLSYAIVFGETSLQSFNVIKTDYVVENTFIERTINMKGQYLELGAQYEYSLSKNKGITVGAIFSPKQTLKSKNSLLVTNTDLSYIVEAKESEAVKSDYPVKIGFGISYKETDKLIAGIDYSMQDWTGASIHNNTSPYFNKMNSINAGLEYLPNKFSSKGYFNKLRYRLGARFLKTYLSLPESQTLPTLHPVQEMAASFGIGLPLKMSANNVNISIEAGKRKTNSNLLPKETFYVLNLNFTLNENWFYKRKIN